MDIELPKKKRFKHDPDSVQIIEQPQQKHDIITIEDEIDKNNDKTIDDKSDSTTIKTEINNSCPYLNTIDRKTLDFDFEKLCSVSLSKVNVYACLVCGKYFQGRGKSTHAFTHSINLYHHIFLNLETHKFYCLPDNYEVQDPSLKDILYVLKPTFDEQVIDYLNNLREPVKAYDGKLYYPGIVGLNNLKYNDYCNVVFQALSHVIPFRDYFLIDSNYANILSSSKTSKSDAKYLLLQRFGELVRKLWNPKNFKAHVSPHEMLQAIVTTSKKKFEFTKQSDPIIFLGWFLNSLLNSSKDKNSIIIKTFQGQIRISTRLLLPNVATSSTELEPELVPLDEEKIDLVNFIYLSLDLPAMPLFPKKDERGKLIKPRISIYDLFSKYDGKTTHHVQTAKECSIKRYEILKLPRYLIIYYKRFTKNTFFMEKNTHIVDFPIDNLNLTNFLVNPMGQKSSSEDKMNDLSLLASSKPSMCYSLIANIVHDGEPEAGKGIYRAHILHRRTGKWFELQDLYVTEVSDTTLITLSESYIQIWELKEG